jgi:hypothetical protein
MADDNELGTRCIISGGEVLEICAPQKGGNSIADIIDDDIPF